MPGMPLDRLIEPLVRVDPHPCNHPCALQDGEQLLCCRAAAASSSTCGAAKREPESHHHEVCGGRCGRL